MRRLAGLLLLLIGTFLTSAPTLASDGRVALVIGNGAYKNAPELPNPPNDAADMAAALRRIGFDVVEGRNLAKRAMEDKIREFSHKLDNAKVALFFYAGHGLQVGGKNYLVPIDAELERPGDLDFETIDIGLVLAQMESDKRVNLVFLDACRNNPLARSLARALGTRSAAVGQGLASIRSGLGTMIAYATQPDNVALDGNGRNSPFTTALLKYIGTPGWDISSVMRHVRADVVAATSDRQVPWDHSSLVGDVVLVPGSTSPQAVAPPSSAPASPPSQPSAPPPVPASRATSAVPAFTNEVLKSEPPLGQLPTGAAVLVDDGTCPSGQIKQVIGGNMATQQPRVRSCVARRQ